MKGASWKANSEKWTEFSQIQNRQFWRQSVCFCLSSFTHWGFGSTTRKIIRVWMFDEDKKKKKWKTTAEFEYLPPEFVLIVRNELKGKLQTRELFKFSIDVVNGFVFVWVISHAEVCTTRKIVCVWTVRWTLKKHAPPPKKVCTVTVCVSKVYDLNSDLFTILAFKGS